MTNNNLTISQMKNLDGKEMTVRELITSGYTSSPFLKILVSSTGEKVEPDNLIKYSNCKGKFIYYEDDDGQDSNGRTIRLPVLFFEIGGK